MELMGTYIFSWEGRYKMVHRPWSIHHIGVGSIPSAHHASALSARKAAAQTKENRHIFNTDRFAFDNLLYRK